MQFPYTFHIGASWAAKESTSFRPRLPHHSDTDLGTWRDHMLTSARKFGSRKGDAGEDFFFIQQHHQSYISIGVADGVGSWVADGVDPSLFPQALMYYAYQSSRSLTGGEPEINPTLDNEEHEEIKVQKITPYECLDLAYSSVLRENDVEIGSSTACIIDLNASSGVLRSANLGDSGYLVIRSNSIFYTSPPQMHRFNVPRQLGKSSGPIRSDPPSAADKHEVELCDGDIVMVFTDGLSDNVFSHEMVATLRSAQAGETEDEQVQNMADRMVDYAQECMRSFKASPFDDEARKVGMWDRCGGKRDDVVVIVALVRKAL